MSRMRAVSTWRRSMVRSRLWCRGTRTRCWRLAGTSRRRVDGSSRLRVSHAFHSRRMEEMLEPFGRVVRGLRLRPPTVPIISNVTGALVERGRADDSGVLGAARAPDGAVLSSGSNAGARRHRDVFGAWSAGGADSALVQEGLSEAAQGRARLWAALRKERDEVSSLLTALGGLYAHGQSVDWSAFFGPLDARRCRCRPIRLSGSATGWRRRGSGWRRGVGGAFVGGASAAGCEHRGGGRRQLCLYRSSVAGHACRGLPGTWCLERCCCRVLRLWSWRWRRQSGLAWTRSMS